jgi:hypothetical protein
MGPAKVERSAAAVQGAAVDTRTGLEEGAAAIRWGRRSYSIRCKAGAQGVLPSSDGVSDVLCGVGGTP